MPFDDVIAVDTETTGLTFFDSAFGGSVADATGSMWFELPADKEEMSSVLRGKTLVFHNAKFDIQKLQLAGVLERADRFEFHDTEALAHLIDENQIKKLKVLAREVLGEDTSAEEELIAYCRKKSNGIDKKKDGYSRVPRDILVPYAVKDAEYTYALWTRLWPVVESDPDLRRLYDLERELLWVLLDMEWAGLKVDLGYAQETARTWGSRVLKAEMACRDAAGNEEFNPNSNPQIKEYFESKGIESDSFNKKALAQIDDPMADALLELRSTSKLHSTYLLPLVEEQRDGILHPNFRQHGTRTGRMSSGKAEG